MNILNLDGYKIIKTEQAEHDYCIQVETVKASLTGCLHCGSADTRRYGSKSVLFMDLPMHGKRVGVSVDRQRYHCKACGKTFFESLPHMDEKRLCTERFITYTSNQSLIRTFTSVAEEVGVNETTIRHIFADHIKELGSVKAETPRWLGIDEIHLSKPRCVLTNVEENTVLDLLSSRDKKTVINYLVHLPDRHRVELVAIDMWQPYKQAVEFCLPKAQIVIDKFHVVRMANEGLDKVRKALKSELTPKERRSLKRDRYVLLRRERDLEMKDQLFLHAWCEQFPILRTAYRLKENFYGIWEQPTKITKQEAYQLYQDWLKQVTPEVAESFLPLITALDNWNQYILNYFETPITNAYTESLNSLIRVADRMGRGHSFEVLRAKILYTRRTQAIRRPKYDRGAFTVKETEVVINEYVKAEDGLILIPPPSKIPRHQLILGKPGYGFHHYGSSIPKLLETYVGSEEAKQADQHE